VDDREVVAEHLILGEAVEAVVRGVCRHDDAALIGDGDGVSGYFQH
jgi:hypothetical protein